jgi:predicted ATP-dependent protease
MARHQPLKPAELYHHCNLKLLRFKSTAELEPLDHPMGQQRALEAIEFGVDVQRDGFNLFVFGESGLGKHEVVRQILDLRARSEPVGFDWCYVNNFKNPQKPLVLKLPTGLGHKLHDDMQTLVEDLLTALPSTFHSEEYRNQRQQIEDELHARQEQMFKRLNADAEKQGIAILRTPSGYTLGPIVKGELLNSEEFNKLPEDERERIEKLITDLQLELQNFLRDLPLLQREHHQRIKALNREITDHSVEKLIAWIEQEYRDQPEVLDYLAEVKNFAIENVETFLPQDGQHEVENLGARVAELHEFSVNVIVDNADSVGAPVIQEDNPTYQNLVGRTEYVSQMGTLITDFTLVKSGALHRANGGYLILDAHKVLTHAFAWEGLKRALKSGEIKVQSLERMLGLASNVSLEPESMPLQVKLVLTGEPLLYFLLKQYDPEFSQLFKVAADFSRSTERSDGNTLLYARLITSIQQRNDYRPLDRASVARIIEHASRAAEDREKLSLHMDSMSELLTEADYWAGKDGSVEIRVEHIEKSIDKRRSRLDKYEELLQEQITRGIKLIDTEGGQRAQVNALSVLQIGDFSFGQPSRITATARLGKGSIIDIERESRLGGQIHSKGVMILSAYLDSTYAADQPLPLSASIVFEQSYGMVDGDSASAAELCVLLSALGNIPLKQNFAVTGSINQLGEIQAIGGVNEKIEGFFDICKARGLSGEQGVIIPHSNRAHLMLRRDVRDAVRDKQFSIYCAQHVFDVMELLSGMPRGRPGKTGIYTKNSFNFLIQQRIENLRQQQKQLLHPSTDDAKNAAKGKS